MDDIILNETIFRSHVVYRLCITLETEPSLYVVFKV